MNNVNIIGRLVRDPEPRTTTSGKVTVSFTIAVDKRSKPRDGSPTADFFRCTAWDRQAEYICNYGGKGRLVGVSGRLEQRSWTSPNGEKREAVEIVVDNVSLLDRPRDDAPQGSGRGVSESVQPATAAPADEYDPFQDI